MTLTSQKGVNKSMNVIIIGGGPAGMLCAISAAKYGNNVTIIEKNNTLGKKLLITGKGRCNITSSLKMSDIIQNIPRNGKFLFSAFQNFTNNDIICLLKKQGLDVKKERGNRIFPVTDNAQDVLNALLKECINQKVKIRTNTKAIKIQTENGKVVGIKTRDLINKKEKIEKADKIVVATGGKSYPTTGSTGDGYQLVQELGHSIIPIKGSLVPLIVNNVKLCKQLQGLSLRNVQIQFLDKKNNKLIYEDFGEMLFTHFGVSGPTILSGSAHLLRHKNVEELMRKK